MLAILIERVFHSYSLLLAKHHKLFLVVPLIIVTILTFGWLRFDTFKNPRATFTPAHSFWKNTENELWKFYGASVDGAIYVVLEPRQQDGGQPRNVLETSTAADLVEIIDYIENNITLEGDKHLSDVLDRRAPHFELYQLIKSVMRLKASNISSGLHSIKYPVSTVLRQPLFMPLAFGDARAAENGSVFARSLLLCFLLKFDAAGYDSVVNASTRLDINLHWEFKTKLDAFASNNDLHPGFGVKVFTWVSLLIEMRETTFMVLRFTFWSFTLMFGFTILVTFSWTVDESLHLHAIAGLISVLLSFLSSMGFMYGLGFVYNDLVAVTSFLALAIGVDDSFIMLEGWKRHRDILDPLQRLSPMLRECGSSVFFTSLTDVLAFGIGATMDIPALRDFCLFTGVAIFFDFLLQVTFYPAALVFCDAMLPKINRLTRLDKIAEKVQGRFKVANKKKLMMESEGHRSLVGAVVWSIVQHRAARIFFIFQTAVFSAIALYGITTMRPDSDITKLVPDKSYVIKDMVSFDRQFWSKGTLFQFAADSPDITNQFQVDNFLKLVMELESLPNSVGSSSTNLWLRDFNELVESFEVSSEQVPAMAVEFLAGQEIAKRHMAFESKFDSYSNQSVRLPTRFPFSTAYVDLDTWELRADLMEEIEMIMLKYPQYNIAAYSDVEHLGDVLLYTRHALKKTLGTVLICTFFIVILFMPMDGWHSLFLNVLMATSFMITNASVIGFLALWNVDIDIISLVTILMSVGFSVDYTVHMAYTYARQNVMAVTACNKEKVRLALQEVCTPIVLAASSTILATILMVFVDSYMIRVFLKTIVLVVFFGLTQSLFVLPSVFLCLGKRR